MNDEPPPIVPAPRAPSTYVHSADESSPEDNPQLSAADIASRKKKNREVFNKKRGELLDDVLRSFDMLIYAELSVIYYMDCFFFRFFIRAIVQLIFLTPKSGMLPEPPANRPYIGAILGVNILCFILHAFSGSPSASDATRGYLHGGLVMDFIGQKGPSSKMHLLLLDVLVAILQITHLSAHLLRQRLRHDSPQNGLALFSQRQNMDDEERGVRHSEEIQNHQEVEIESLNRIGVRDNDPEEITAGSSNTVEQVVTAAVARTDAHIFDAFNSGQIVLADLNLVQVVQEQLLAYQKSTSQEALRDESRRLLGDRLAGLRGLQWAR